MIRSTFQAGFTAVELLVTLFIAAAFIATGYQLYSVVIADGGTALQQAQATNIAYDNLRRYSSEVTNPCSVVTPTPTPTIPAGTSLTNPSITVAITCPYTTSLNLSMVTVTVTYGIPQKQVVHALFINLAQ